MFFKLSKEEKYGRPLIYQTSDQYGPIEVAETNTHRSLHFGTSPKQSEILKAHPYLPALEYNQAMLAALLFCPHPRNIFCMGLGGGTIPFAIHHFFPDSTVLVCELRRRVYDVAREYFFFPLHPNISVVFAEGLYYLKNTEHSFDMLFIDAFSADGLAGTLLENNIADIFSRHTPDGTVLVLNLWRTNYGKHEEIFRYFSTDKSRIYLIHKTISSGNIIYFIMTKATLVHRIKNMSAALNEYETLTGMGLKNIIRAMETENNMRLL